MRIRRIVPGASEKLPTRALGTGGGGDPYISRLLLKQEMEHGRSITIIPPEALADDATTSLDDSGFVIDDEFSFDGEHYAVADSPGLPKPVQQPGPPLWRSVISPGSNMRSTR